jgi:uncharacterized protein YndB with AHSA1/START domain
VSGSVPAGAPARGLTLRRTYPCAREEVFAAWTEPDALASWFGGAVAETLSAAVDLRVGGAYRLTVQNGAQVGSVEGVYKEVTPPERLVYTWRWDRTEIEGGRESLVTVEFHDRDGATEVVVTHEGIKTDESFAFHVGGWTASLEELWQVLPLTGGPGEEGSNGASNRPAA